MKVLDASVVIAFLDGDDAHHGDAVHSLETCAEDGLAINVVTLAEILVGPMRARRDAQVMRELAGIGIQVVGIPVDAGQRLAELRLRTGLRMPDCCVLLAAQQVSGDVLTFDQRLAASARDVLGMP